MFSTLETLHKSSHEDLAEMALLNAIGLDPQPNHRLGGADPEPRAKSLSHHDFGRKSPMMQLAPPSSFPRQFSEPVLSGMAQKGGGPGLASGLASGAVGGAGVPQPRGSMAFLTHEQLREAAAEEVRAQLEAKKMCGEKKGAGDDGDAAGGKKRKGGGGGGGGGGEKKDTKGADKDRSREHARLTRLRKKAYVAKLSQLVMDLTAQREQQEREAAHAAAVKRERDFLRTAAVRSMFAWRCAGECDLDRWRTVLDEDFVCTLPITPFRTFKQSEISGATRSVRGLNALVADVKSLQLCIEFIGAPAPWWKAARLRGEKVTAHFTLGHDEIVLSGDTAMAPWLFTTTNAVSLGAEAECALNGMVRIAFTNQNKLRSAEWVFDSMTFMQQLLCAANGNGQGPAPSGASGASGAGGGSSSSSASSSAGGAGGGPSVGSGHRAAPGRVGNDVVVVATTVQMACGNSTLARAVVHAAPPFVCVHAAPSWAAAVGSPGAGHGPLTGRPLSLLQPPAGGASGPGEASEAARFFRELHAGRPASMVVTLKASDGKLTQSVLRVLPLTSNNSSEISHFLAELI